MNTFPSAANNIDEKNDLSFWNIESNESYRTGNGFGNPERWLLETPHYLVPLHSIIALIGTFHALFKVGYHGACMLYHEPKSFDQAKGIAIDAPIENLLLEDKDGITLKKITNLVYTRDDLPQLEHALQLTRHKEAFRNTWKLVKFFAFAVIPFFGHKYNIYHDEISVFIHAPLNVQFRTREGENIYCSKKDALEALITHLKKSTSHDDWVSESDSLSEDGLPVENLSI